MKLEHYNSELPISDDAFAWRYVSFQKLIDLLTSNEIYFSRLDQFDDPIEGFPLKLRTSLHMKRYYRVYREFLSKHIDKDLGDKIIIKRSEINLWQQGAYISCWYLREQSNVNDQNHIESLAMWNLYSDKYGVVIKLKFSLLKELISNSLDSFSDAEICRAAFGKIDYLTFIEDATRKLTSAPMPALIKHKSFKHENEIRFIFMREQPSLSENRRGIRFKVSEPLKNYKDQIQIISHPDMDISVEQSFKTKIESLGFQLSPSELFTKNNYRNLIHEDSD